jgi:hypothetical protein
MSGRIRILDSDRLEVCNIYGWTEGTEIAVTIGATTTLTMTRDRGLALMRCLDEVLNASAIDEPIGGPAIEELDQFRENAA